MSKAQRRRELADKLDTEEGASFFDAANEAIALLRSDAAALEAVEVEPAAWRYRHPLLQTHWKLDCCPTPPGFKVDGWEDEPLYPAESLALRLTEALRQRDALAEVLKAVLQTGRGTSGRIILERLQEADIRAVLREVGHE